MRNRKKWIAALTAVCMIVPTGTVFAAAPTYPGDTTVGGDGVVEYDPEEIDEFIDIVLPTTSTTAYNFTLDPLDILSDYNPEYDGNSSVYFKKQTSQAVIKSIKTGTDGKIYIKEPVLVEDTDLPTELNTMLAGTVAGTPAVTGDYYVWVPDTANKPMGKFEKITTTNVADYVDFTADTTSFTANGMKKGNVNTDTTAATVVGVSDGHLYKEGYVELQTPYDVTDYVTVDASGNITAVSSTNIIYTGDGAGAFTAAAEADLEYVDAVIVNIGESDDAKIVNKSSNNTLVRVTATLTNVGNLGLTDDKTFADDATASVYMAVKNGANETAIVSDGATSPAYKAEVEYVLDGANDLTKYVVYQSGTNTNTGGHNYVRYAMQDMTYDETTFSLTAQANTAAGKAVWNEYAAGLTGTGSLPKISVVYHVEKGPEAKILNFKSWSNDDLWFGDGIFTDRAKLTSIVAVETDGSETGQITIKGDDGNGYLNVTWSGIVAAGHDDTVPTGYKLRVVYDGETYELSL